MNDKNKIEICNFTFISEEEKSKINNMRYCLHRKNNFYKVKSLYFAS